MKGKNFGSEATAHQYTTGQSQHGSENPDLTEEAQMLLSRFMRSSSQKLQETQGDGPSDWGVDTHSRADFHLAPKTSTKAENNVNRHRSYAGSDDSMSESSLIQNNSTPQRVYNGARQRGQSQRSSSKSSEDHAFSMKRSQHLREVSPNAEMYEFPNSSTKSSNNASRIIPQTERKFSPKGISQQAVTAQSANYRSTDVHSPKPPPTKSKSQAPPAARRSGRQKTEPVNYYEKMCLFVDSDENDVSDGVDASRSQKSVLRSSPDLRLWPPKSFREHKIADPWDYLQTYIIHSSPDIHILRSSYTSLDNLGGLDRAPYAPERNPVYYGRRIGEKAEAKVLHVDFDQGEMAAILNLLSFYACQGSLYPESSLADQVIKIMSTNKHPATFVNGISWMCELARILLEDGVTDMNTWLLQATKSNLVQRKLPRVKRLIKDIGSSQSIADEDNSRLSSHLTHAFALRRRHSSDIHAFLSDAVSGHLSTVPCIIRAVRVKDKDSSVSCRTLRSLKTLNRTLHNRELGCDRLQADFAGELKPSKYWKGASNDVIVLAWSPDGTRFAAGATAQCDQHNMAYNRGNNLVLGDLTKNSLKELPDHRISHPGGADPLFMSVTSMQWFDDILFTASYDNTVKLWDVASYTNARCSNTLRHDSKVQVMARSNFDQDTLATGANSIGLWNIKELNYTPLEIQQRQRKKDIELVPTSLAWGTIQATKNILLAGMSEKEDGVPQNGLLAVWRADEASTTPLHLSPNSQNIFDIKWHPSMPYFATGSAAAPSRASTSKSVVRVYQPLVSKMNTMEFDCPALDINDVTFCPTNPNYVTASCTDGSTYVWDWRNPKNVLLELQHAWPLNQVDENIPREQADVGVRLALWGNGVDQFYSGASDGVLKRWDILRSQEDAHVCDVTKFQEEIMGGVFSSDKTNLLIGDAAGGIHVLSSSPFHNNEDLRMTFERANEDVHDGNADTESGVEAAAELAKHGRLVRHPIFGFGQGPHYDGPFADWARHGYTPRNQFARPSLRDEILVRQLDGAPLEHRRGLDEQSRKDIASHIQLARIRNQQQHENKRKRQNFPSSSKAVSGDSNFINLCSEEEEKEKIKLPRPKSKSKRRAAKAQARSRAIKTGPEFIDLTLDSDPEDEVASLGKGTPSRLQENKNEGEKERPIKNERHQSEWYPPASGPGLVDPVTNHLSKLGILEELEEDFWWPDNIDPNIQDTDP